MALVFTEAVKAAFLSSDHFLQIPSILPSFKILPIKTKVNINPRPHQSLSSKMCSPFRCTGSFKNWKDHDFDELPTPIRTPRRSKSYRSYSSRRKESKNPYASQGLDKFSALVEKLEAEKQKIYTQKGSEDISLIYFTYNQSDHEFKPFIVRVKKKRQDTSDDHGDAKTTAKDDKVLMKRDSIKSSSANVVGTAGVQQIKKDEQTSQICKTLWSVKPKNCRHIFGCFSVTLVLILLLLVFSGRSFTILCTTVAWYVAPTLVTKIAPAQKKTNEAVPSRKNAPAAQKTDEKKWGSPNSPLSSPKKALHSLPS